MPVALPTLERLMLPQQEHRVTPLGVIVRAIVRDEISITLAYQ